jgi:transcriptional regulator with XRE-family HTH domain
MNDPAMTPHELIAVAVQRERQRAGLSLGALAEAAGIAKSTLSQLEARKGNPSIETLWAIATALGVPFAQFFEVAVPAVALVRAHEGDSVAAETSGDMVVLLANCPVGVRRDLYRMTLRAGASRVAAAHPQGTVEHAFVCSGRVRIGPEGQLVEAAAGDYYRYPGDVPHHYEALDGDSLILVVMESPR